MDIYEDKDWGAVSSDTRESLMREQYSEYSAFTGTDIKAFILPQGDQLARTQMAIRLSELSNPVYGADNHVQDNFDKINFVSQDGDFTERITKYGKTPETDRGLSHDILPLVNLQSITISTFRAKSQVRALGHVNAVGLARGSRTIAGTFILTEFNRDAFWDILTPSMRDVNYGDTGQVLPDQMRPFDIILLFAHEMGSLAIRHIYGLEVVTNGVVYSIQDYYSENTVSYIAQDVGPLIPLTPAFDGDDYASNSNLIRLNNLITNLRGETLGQDFEYIKAARNPFK